MNFYYLAGEDILSLALASTVLAAVEIGRFPYLFSSKYLVIVSRALLCG